MFEGVGTGEGDREADGWRLVVDGDRGDELGGAGGGFDEHGAVVSVLRRGPFSGCFERGGDDEGGDVFLCPGFERGLDAVFLRDEPLFHKIRDVQEGFVVEVDCDRLGFFLGEILLVEVDACDVEF